ncbi:hypothetical protein X975_12541, partial [Stegodyphus mimosarum]
MRFYHSTLPSLPTTIGQKVPQGWAGPFAVVFFVRMSLAAWVPRAAWAGGLEIIGNLTSFFQL